MMAKVALITGCGKGGIGEALVKEFHRNKFIVIGTVLPSENPDHLVDTGIYSCCLDVSEDESVDSLFQRVSEIGAGRLDVMVNNAGIAYTTPATDHDLREVERMFAVNVFGPMRMVKKFSSLLVHSKGTVVNIGSVGGIVPFVYGASYNASKAALVHYGSTLRVELKPFGVKVINVISGEIGTNILKNDYHRQLPPGSLYKELSKEFKAHVQRTPKTMSPEDYARGVVKEAMKSNPRAFYWRGQNAGLVRWVDTFLWRTAWDPVFLRWFSFDKLKPSVHELSRL